LHTVFQEEVSLEIMHSLVFRIAGAAGLHGIDVSRLFFTNHMIGMAKLGIDCLH
jgi:hypothetical protein